MSCLRDDVADTPLESSHTLTALFERQGRLVEGLWNFANLVLHHIEVGAGGTLYCRCRRPRASECPHAYLSLPGLDRHTQEAHTKIQPSRGDPSHRQRTKVSANLHPDERTTSASVQPSKVKWVPTDEQRGTQFPCWPEGN